jgi:hypothetical protein
VSQYEAPDRTFGTRPANAPFAETNPNLGQVKYPSEMSRRDGAIVAWHEVPGTAPLQKGPSRRVRCGRYLAGSKVQKRSMTTRNTFRIGCLQSYRTLRDDSLEGAFLGTSCHVPKGQMRVARRFIAEFGTTWGRVPEGRPNTAARQFQRYRSSKPIPCFFRKLTSSSWKLLSR